MFGWYVKHLAKYSCPERQRHEFDFYVCECLLRFNIFFHEMWNVSAFISVPNVFISYALMLLCFSTFYFMCCNYQPFFPTMWGITLEICFVLFCDGIGYIMDYDDCISSLLPYVEKNPQYSNSNSHSPACDKNDHSWKYLLVFVI